MRIIADLHIHSKYARATSKHSDLLGLSEGAKIKGINLLGTGDFTHPSWFRELKANLKESESAGLGVYEYNNIFFILSCEVSVIYELNGRIKKMHHVLFSPDLETVASINDVLSSFGNLSEDGRPTLKISSAELVEVIKEINPLNEIIPAHAWTPWFAVFGSRSGVNSIEEAFEDKAKHIFALETGLSSDPLMNWMISSLDKYSLVSNSDAHSPEKLGREANVFELSDLSYSSLFNSIRTRKGFLKTYEFYPEEGKYHYDGHRKCGVVLSPWDAMKYNNICPVCKKPLTIGVLHRVVELSDRKYGFRPKDAVPFDHIVPLPTIISKVLKKGENTLAVRSVYEDIIRKFGSEFSVFEADDKKILSLVDKRIADAILKVKGERVRWKPGFDGVFGELFLDSKERFKEEKMDVHQSVLDDF